jgi:hypothetical protein
MVNRYYSIYQAERGKTRAELRAADIQIGEFVAELAQLGSTLATPVRAVRRSLRRWRPVELSDRARRRVRAARRRRPQAGREHISRGCDGSRRTGSERG